MDLVSQLEYIWNSYVVDALDGLVWVGNETSLLAEM